MQQNDLATAARDTLRAMPYVGGAPRGYMSGGFGISRDSDALERSNYATAWTAYETAGVDVRADSFGHWAVGWIDEMVVPISRAAVDVLAELRAAVDDYPVLDEMDWSAREWEDNHPTETECYAETADYCPCAVATAAREGSGAA